MSNNLSINRSEGAALGVCGGKSGIGRGLKGDWLGSKLLQEPCSLLSEPLPSGLDWVLYGVCIGRTRVLRRRSCAAGVAELSLEVGRKGVLIFRVGLNQESKDARMIRIRHGGG